MRGERAFPSPRTCMLNERALELAGDEMQRDLEYVKSVVELNGMALKHASFILRNNKEVVTAAVQNNSASLQFASEGLTSNYKFMMDMCGVNYRCVEHAHPFLLDDEEYMLNALQVNGAVVRFMSERLRSSREVMRKAAYMVMHESVLAYCAEKLRNDHDFVLDVVLINGLALQHASKTLRKDPEIVDAAVSQNGLALAYASSRLRANQQIVSKAVAQNERALAYASDDLKRDRSLAQRCSTTHIQHDIVALVNRQVRASTAPGGPKPTQMVPNGLSQRPHSSAGARRQLSYGRHLSINSQDSRLSIEDPFVAARKSRRSRSPGLSVNNSPSLNQEEPDEHTVRHASICAIHQRLQELEDQLLQQNTQQNAQSNVNRPVSAGRISKGGTRNDTNNPSTGMTAVASTSSTDSQDFMEIPSRNLQGMMQRSQSRDSPKAATRKGTMDSLALATVLPWDEAEEEADARIAQHNQEVLRARKAHAAETAMQMPQTAFGVHREKAEQEAGGPAMVHQRTLLPGPKKKKNEKNAGKQVAKTLSMLSDQEEEGAGEVCAQVSSAPTFKTTLSAFTRAMTSKALSADAEAPANKSRLSGWTGGVWEDWKPTSSKTSRTATFDKPATTASEEVQQGPRSRMTRIMTLSDMAAEGNVVKDGAGVPMKKVKSSNSKKRAPHITSSLKEALDMEKTLSIEKARTSALADSEGKDKVQMQTFRFGNNLGLPKTLRRSLGFAKG